MCVVKKWHPDIVDHKSALLWYRVVLKNLDGFSHAPGVPVLNGCDEFCVGPVDAMILLLSMFDDS